MKKVAGIIAICAALVLAPASANAHKLKHHHDAEMLVGVGGGAVAGAVVGGPVGAVVGGLVGWIIVEHHH